MVVGKSKNFTFEHVSIAIDNVVIGKIDKFIPTNGITVGIGLCL